MTHGTHWVIDARVVRQGGELCTERDTDSGRGVWGGEVNVCESVPRKRTSYTDPQQCQRTIHVFIKKIILVHPEESSGIIPLEGQLQ